jgi:hypothetical protein
MKRAAGSSPCRAFDGQTLPCAAQADHRGALEAKLTALERLRQECKNSNERGWLDYSIASVKAQLGDAAGEGRAPR